MLQVNNQMDTLLPFFIPTSQTQEANEAGFRLAGYRAAIQEKMEVTSEGTYDSITALKANLEEKVKSSAGWWKVISIGNIFSISVPILPIIISLGIVGTLSGIPAMALAGEERTPFAQLATDISIQASCVAFAAAYYLWDVHQSLATSTQESLTLIQDYADFYEHMNITHLKEKKCKEIVDEQLSAPLSFSTFKEYIADQLAQLETDGPRTGNNDSAEKIVQLFHRSHLTIQDLNNYEDKHFFELAAAQERSGV